MAITPEFIDKLSAILSRAGLSEASVAAVRDAFPDLHFTYCSDDDVGVAHTPVHRTDSFNIYLIDGNEHCLRFTRDLDAATGLVLAEVTPDYDASCVG